MIVTAITFFPLAAILGACCFWYLTELLVSIVFENTKNTALLNLDDKNNLLDKQKKTLIFQNLY